jgi:motility quorum-sensing regulator/GCU-specific mRNA interferase toxin
MEKRTPHSKLSLVKSMVEAGQVNATRSALTSAEIMGLGFDDIIDIIMALSQKDFYKSMTTHADHKAWQDVYRPLTEAGEVYLKLTVTNDVLIVSFKEL